MSDQPSLPYAGTEGWSGSDTSRERAYNDATDGTASKRQRDVLDLMSRQEGDGVTWSEVADALNLHHGQASGSLSALHKEAIGVGLVHTAIALAECIDGLPSPSRR